MSPTCRVSIKANNHFSIYKLSRAMCAFEGSPLPSVCGCVVILASVCWGGGLCMLVHARAR